VDSQRTLIQAALAPRRAGAAPPSERAGAVAPQPADEPPRWRIVARADGPRADGPSAEEPAVEERVLGRYRLLERLGTGGFGVVWRAHDELLHREVAVKRVWLGPDGDSERASREAHATARLSHPAIVALYEACAQDGAFYLISELVDGDTLAQLIDEDALGDEEVLEIGAALASALAHAHERGVIHRDIKPQNVLVPHPPEERAHAPRALLVAAKLTDFGGASLVGEDALTRTGDVLGTLAYMAPEQSEGREVAEPADLYSLALVIYEALCGENPVRGATPAATVRRIGRALPPLARSRRDLPAELTRAVDRALAPEAHERGTLEHLRDALEQALANGLRRSRWRRARPLAAPEPVPAVPARSLEPRHDSEPRHRGSLALAHDAPAAPGEEQPAAEPAATPHRGLRLPRGVWLAAALALVLWQAFAGRVGVSLLLFAALLPLALLPSERADHRLGIGWIAAALAPVLGLAGLAGAFPALAGQASRWRERAVLGALGYWWLTLAAALLDRKLWLALPARTPARSAWEGSLSLAARHVLGPRLALGVLLGALLWAAAAVALAWLVRGRSAVVDIVAVSIWSAALAAAAPALDGGLAAGVVHPEPRGAVLGAILGALAAVAARALRGPV
jgi:serine/threonine protein kinase